MSFKKSFVGILLVTGAMVFMSCQMPFVDGSAAKQPVAKEGAEIGGRVLSSIEGTGPSVQKSQVEAPAAVGGVATTEVLSLLQDMVKSCDTTLKVASTGEIAGNELVVFHTTVSGPVDPDKGPFPQETVITYDGLGTSGESGVLNGVLKIEWRQAGMGLVTGEITCDANKEIVLKFCGVGYVRGQGFMSGNVEYKGVLYAVPSFPLSK